MSIVLIVVLIVTAFLLGWSAGFYHFEDFLREEHSAVLDMLREEMDREWRNDDDS